LRNQEEDESGKQESRKLGQKFLDKIWKPGIQDRSTGLDFIPGFMV
jgi:hypothetical protein